MSTDETMMKELREWLVQVSEMDVNRGRHIYPFQVIDEIDRRLRRRRAIDKTRAQPEERNGSKPIEAVPYYFGTPPDPQPQPDIAIICRTFGITDEMLSSDSIHTWLSRMFCSRQPQTGALREALVKVVAHTGYLPGAPRELLKELIDSCRRIADAALLAAPAPAEPEPCKTCDGTRAVEKVDWPGEHANRYQKPCPDCADKPAEPEPVADNVCGQGLAASGNDADTQCKRCGYFMGPHICTKCGSRGAPFFEVRA